MSAPRSRSSSSGPDGSGVGACNSAAPASRPPTCWLFMPSLPASRTRPSRSADLCIHAHIECVNKRNNAAHAAYWYTTSQLTNVSVPPPPKHWSTPGPPSILSLPGPPKSASSPASPESVSLPASPESVSLPWSPESVSLPGPPKSRSLPWSPKSRSSPALPQALSLPPKEWTRSSPSRASIQSAPAVPRMVSLPLVPTLVAGAHRGSRAWASAEKAARKATRTAVTAMTASQKNRRRPKVLVTAPLPKNRWIRHISQVVATTGCRLVPLTATLDPVFAASTSSRRRCCRRRSRGLSHTGLLEGSSTLPSRFLQGGDTLPEDLL